MPQIDVAASSDVRAGALHACKAGSTALLLTRVGQTVYAVENRCSHLGLPLSKGKLCDGAITCPWHGSRFDMKTGKNLDWVNSFVGMPMPRWTHGLIAMGKSPAGLKTFEAREAQGRVSVIVP